jgi:hypothetical protein
VHYMLLLYVSERAEPGSPAAAEALAAMSAFHADCRDRGVLVASDPLHRPEAATTVRERDGRIVHTDGPFAESAEWLGGYFMIDCADLDEALAIAARCPTAKHGSVEVRPVIDVGAGVRA